MKEMIEESVKNAKIWVFILKFAKRRNKKEIPTQNRRVSENKEKMVKFPLGEGGHIRRHEIQTSHVMEQYLKISKGKVIFNLEFMA